MTERPAWLQAEQHVDAYTEKAAVASFTALFRELAVNSHTTRIRKNELVSEANNWLNFIDPDGEAPRYFLNNDGEVVLGDEVGKTIPLKRDSINYSDEDFVPWK